MKNFKIMVLDDAKSVHERVKRAFSGRGIEVHATDSWVDTKTAVFSSNPPDLLILDLQMPTIDGRAVGRAIKRRLAIPIIIFSSEDAKQLSQAMTDVGAEAALSKSSPDSELLNVAMRLLGAGTESTQARAVL